MSSARRLQSVLLSIGAAGVIGSCSPDFAVPTLRRQTPADERLDSLPLLPPLGFVKCTPQPYAANTVAIGPAGGVISVNGHRLIVPAGALNSTISITMEAPSDTIRSVRFSPEGLTFNARHRPTLEMDYSQCMVLAEAPKRIVYTDEQWNILERLSVIDLLALLELKVPLDHFSRYAVHY